jgi:hypothetical protein
MGENRDDIRSIMTAAHRVMTVFVPWPDLSPPGDFQIMTGPVWE